MTLNFDLLISIAAGLIPFVPPILKIMQTLPPLWSRQRYWQHKQAVVAQWRADLAAGANDLLSPLLFSINWRRTFGTEPPILRQEAEFLLSFDDPVRAVKLTEKTRWLIEYVPESGLYKWRENFFTRNRKILLWVFSIGYLAFAYLAVFPLLTGAVLTQRANDALYLIFSVPFFGPFALIFGALVRDLLNAARAIQEQAQKRSLIVSTPVRTGAPNTSRASAKKS